MRITPRFSLERIPKEILTKCLACLNAHDLVNVLSVSRTLRAIASQDVLWEVYCDRIYNKGSSDVLGWRPIRRLGLCNGWNKLSYHLVWRRLALVEPYLGWWLPLDKSPTGTVMRIWLDNQNLVVSHVIPAAGPTLVGNTMGRIFGAIGQFYTGSQSVTIQQRATKQPIQWLYEGPSRIVHGKHTLQTFHASNHSTNTARVRDLLPVGLESHTVHPYEWPFRNSPSLFNVTHHSEVLYDDQGYATATSVPTISLSNSLPHGPHIAIHSPFEEPPPSLLIDEGIWVASYGVVHGCEFVHVHVRTIYEQDISGQWGDDGSLADATTSWAQDLGAIIGLPIPSSSIITPKDVRAGKTIIEATKITGDTNVPRGVRTFVGFLEHNEAWDSPSENGDLQRGTPATTLPTSLVKMKSQHLTASGMTIPGLVRVANTGFMNSRWANATVHIANRREIKVMVMGIGGLGATMFYKVDKSMFKLIR